jgi:hypothetical protein
LGMSRETNVFEDCALGRVVTCSSDRANPAARDQCPSFVGEKG